MSRTHLPQERHILFQFSQWRTLVVVASILGLSILGKAPSAMSQEAAKGKPPVKYDEYKLDDARLFKEKKANKDAMLKGAVTFNRQDVTKFYEGFMLPLLTQTSEPEKGNFARAEILADIALAEKASEAVLADFNAMLMAEMKKIAEGNFQPSASIIATQILGRLNKSRPKNLAPEPLLATVTTLVSLAESGKNDGIRAAALCQVERHIDYYGPTWPDANRQFLADKLLVILKAPRPAARSIRADAWLRGRTLELLLKIKHSKEAEVYQYAIDALANPKTEPVLTEKALLVAGQFPQAPIAPNLVNPIVSNPLQYLVTRLNSWKKEVGESFQASSSSDSGNDAPVDDGGADMVEDVGDGEGNPKKAAKKKAEPKPNPYAKQKSDVINKRRALHEILEIMRYGYTGSRFGTLPTDNKSGLALHLPEGEAREVMTEVMTALKELQDTINSPSITDRTSLGNEVNPKVDALINAIEFLLNNIPKGAEAPPAEAPAAP